MPLRARTTATDQGSAGHEHRSLRLGTANRRRSGQRAGRPPGDARRARPENAGPHPRYAPRCASRRADAPGKSPVPEARRQPLSPATGRGDVCPRSPWAGSMRRFVNCGIRPLEAADCHAPVDVIRIEAQAAQPRRRRGSRSRAGQARERVHASMMRRSAAARYDGAPLIPVERHGGVRLPTCETSPETTLNPSARRPLLEQARNSPSP